MTLRQEYESAWKGWSNDQPASPNEGAGCTLEMHDGNAREALAYVERLAFTPMTDAIRDALVALVIQEAQP